MTAASEKKTPLFQEHQQAEGKLVPFAGYLLPIQYSGIVKEHNAVRTAAGLFDVSHMGEMRACGGTASAFVNSVVTGDLDAIAVGQAMYACACRPDGGILDDLIVYKHAHDDILIVCNASNRDKIWQHLSRCAENVPGLTLRDESDQTALLALQGPLAFEVLSLADASLTDLDKSLRPFRFQSTKLCGASVTIARTGYTGEDGVEIFCANQDAVAIWRALLSAGKSRGVLPAGLGARDTLRLEARLSLYGNELDEETSPLEAGLGWTVKLGKTDFVGQAALKAQAEAGVTRRIVGFEMTGRGVGRSGYPVLGQDGKVIGKVTSGCPSPTLGKAIGLALVSSSAWELGTPLGIDCRGKVIEAVVVKTPFYKRA